MPEVLDGNAAQVRQVVESVVRAMSTTSEAEASLIAKLEARMDEKISAAETKIKYWFIVGLLSLLVTYLPIIFFLGGIYSTGNQAVEMIGKQQALLEKRGDWMDERERWEQGIENWATPKGFTPPRYRSNAGGPP